ncbi:MAG: hypothetical protein ACLU4B_04015 [Bilophila wadsworthia]
MLTMMDPYSYLRDGLKVKELDTLSVTLTDSFASDRLDANMTFTLLKMQSNGHFIKMQLMSTSVYQAKCFVTVSKSFIQKSITEILPYYIKGLKLDIGKFPIVEDYHCLAGERPSRLLRQIAVEKGALVWADRDTLHFQRFQELWKVEPPLPTITTNRMSNTPLPLSPAKPNDRTPEGIKELFGFNLKGSVGGGGVPAFTASQNPITLKNNSVSTVDVIDYYCEGNGALRPGQVIKCLWHTANPNGRLTRGSRENPCKCRSPFLLQPKFQCRVKG